MLTFICCFEYVMVEYYKFRNNLYKIMFNHLNMYKQANTVTGSQSCVEGYGSNLLHFHQMLMHAVVSTDLFIKTKQFSQVYSLDCPTGQITV